MKMKILVMGVMQDQKDVGDNQKYRRKFEAAGYAIGQALAEKGHVIIVNAGSWPRIKDGTGIARYVVLGASSVTPPAGQPPHQIVFYAPRETEPDDQTPAIDTLRELRVLPNVRIVDRFSDKPVRISYRIDDVREADSVIVVDGAAGVQQVATAAFSLGKPVVPLTGFGAIPKELDKHLIGQAYDYLEERGDVTASELRSMHDPWSEEVDDQTNRNTAEAIVALTEKLVAVNVRTERQNTTGLLTTIAITVIPIMIWVCAFTSSYIKSQEWSYFSVLFLSVLPGVGLRTLVSYQQGSTARLTWKGLLVDIAVAIVIAFGLALLFLIGNIAFTGQLAVEFAEGDTSDFARVAVIMSILGLAAGYLVPLGRLRELLENTLAQQS